MKIQNLTRIGEGDETNMINTLTKEIIGPHVYSGGWEWEIVFDDGTVSFYHTDKDGCGLWQHSQQTRGTCDFSLPKSRSGAYGKIKRTFTDVE